MPKPTNGCCSTEFSGDLSKSNYLTHILICHIQVVGTHQLLSPDTSPQPIRSPTNIFTYQYVGLSLSQHATVKLSASEEQLKNLTYK